MMNLDYNNTVVISKLKQHTVKEFNTNVFSANVLLYVRWYSELYLKLQFVTLSKCEQIMAKFLLKRMRTFILIIHPNFSKQSLKGCDFLTLKHAY